MNWSSSLQTMPSASPTNRPLHNYPPAHGFHPHDTEIVLASVSAPHRLAAAAAEHRHLHNTTPCNTQESEMMDHDLNPLALRQHPGLALREQLGGPAGAGLPRLTMGEQLGWPTSSAMVPFDRWAAAQPPLPNVTNAASRRRRRDEGDLLPEKRPRYDDGNSMDAELSNDGLENEAPVHEPIENRHFPGAPNGGIREVPPGGAVPAFVPNAQPAFVPWNPWQPDAVQNPWSKNCRPPSRGPY